jgi:hypothetical protein
MSDEERQSRKSPREVAEPTTEGSGPEASGSVSAPSVSGEPPSLPSGIDMRDLTRRAFPDDEMSSTNLDVLQGVQDKLSQRSGGKFYGDGWSRTRHPPFSTFFITSLMMIAIVAIIYAILVPVVGEPVELPKQPKPVPVREPIR